MGGQKGNTTRGCRVGPKGKPGKEKAPCRHIPLTVDSITTCILDHLSVLFRFVLHVLGLAWLVVLGTAFIELNCPPPHVLCSALSVCGCTVLFFMWLAWPGWLCLALPALSCPSPHVLCMSVGGHAFLCCALHYLALGWSGLHFHTSVGKVARPIQTYTHVCNNSQQTYYCIGTLVAIIGQPYYCNNNCYYCKPFLPNVSRKNAIWGLQ